MKKYFQFFLKYKRVLILAPLLVIVDVNQNRKGLFKETGFSKDGSNQGRWEWQSLTHKGTTVVGSALGGSISILSDIATPSFLAPASNVLYAGMQLNIILKFTAMSIPDCPIINALPKSFNKSYTIQKMWNANPE